MLLLGAYELQKLIGRKDLTKDERVGNDKVIYVCACKGKETSLNIHH